MTKFFEDGHWGFLGGYLGSETPRIISCHCLPCVCSEGYVNTQYIKIVSHLIKMGVLLDYYKCGFRSTSQTDFLKLVACTIQLSEIGFSWLSVPQYIFWIWIQFKPIPFLFSIFLHFSPYMCSLLLPVLMLCLSFASYESM